MFKHFRIIPILLYKNQGLYKGIEFKNHIYIGDALNTIHVFNEKKVDELFLVDIDGSITGEKIPINIIEKMAQECYFPFGIGGGIKTIEEIRDIIKAGAEKVLINTAAIENPDIISKASVKFGTQSIVVGIDVKKNIFGKYLVYSHCGRKKTNLDPLKWAIEAELRGAGEILLTSINRDGSRKGYDLEIIKKISDAVNIPVVCCGGAGTYEDFILGIRSGAAAVAGGTIFVLYGEYRAMLIQYPNELEKNKIYMSK
ncbi:MAG TPA: HisA/HisF-related TIM barrel protein [bacterium]|nr:HisA/HisF-related TIM barrel protein [bacterium]